MTEKQRRVIDQARMTRSVFLSIPRTCRDTAHENTMEGFARRQAERVTALLEAEQQRLLKTWKEEA